MDYYVISMLSWVDGLFVACGYLQNVDKKYCDADHLLHLLQEFCIRAIFDFLREIVVNRNAMLNLSNMS